MIDPAIHQPTKQRRGTDGQSDQTASLLDEYVNQHTASRMFSMRTNQSVEYFYPPCEVIGDNCRPSCVVDCGRSLSWPSPVQSSPVPGIVQVGMQMWRYLLFSFSHSLTLSPAINLDSYPLLTLTHIQSLACLASSLGSTRWNNFRLAVAGE